jgi:hypothetical protein
MVHIKDEGSYFDLPIESLWQYIEDDARHAPAHKSVRNFEAKPLTDSAFLITNEQNVNGKWVRVVSRQTILAPLGLAVECLEGPLTGSKFVLLYTPKGGKTEVTLVGEFASKTIPEPQLELRVRELFGMAFDEDTAMIRASGSMKK